MWKLVSTITGRPGGLLARKLIRATYQAIRKDTAPATPFDPTNPRFSWPDAHCGRPQPASASPSPR